MRGDDFSVKNACCTMRNCVTDHPKKKLYPWMRGFVDVGNHSGAAQAPKMISKSVL